MSMFDSPETHAANPPETWTVVKQEGGRGWVIQTAMTEEDPKSYMFGKPLVLGWSYSTKRDAIADMAPEGRWGRLYRQESEWYAGGQGALGWKPYSQVKAENDKQDRKRAEAKRLEARKVERMGVSVDTLKEWAEAIHALSKATWSGHVGEVITDEFEVTVNEAADTMTAMLELLAGGTLLDPDELDEKESRELQAGIRETYSTASAVDDQIDRMRYLGLDLDVPALDILEKIQADERAEELRVMHS